MTTEWKNAKQSSGVLGVFLHKGRECQSASGVGGPLSVFWFLSPHAGSSLYFFAPPRTVRTCSRRTRRTRFKMSTPLQTSDPATARFEIAQETLPLDISRHTISKAVRRTNSPFQPISFCHQNETYPNSALILTDFSFRSKKDFLFVCAISVGNRKKTHKLLFSKLCVHS